MRYKEIIEQMKRDGHYSEADALRRSVERRGSTHESIHSRWDARDGLSCVSYAGDCAERAYDEIKSAEYRAEREREDQEREQRRREHEEAMHREAMRQQEAEEAWSEQERLKEEETQEQEPQL